MHSSVPLIGRVYMLHVCPLCFSRYILHLSTHVSSCLIISRGFIFIFRLDYSNNLLDFGSGRFTSASVLLASILQLWSLQLNRSGLLVVIFKFLDWENDTCIYVYVEERGKNYICAAAFSCKSLSKFGSFKFPDDFIKQHSCISCASLLLSTCIQEFNLLYLPRVGTFFCYSGFNSLCLNLCRGAIFYYR